MTAPNDTENISFLINQLADKQCKKRLAGIAIGVVQGDAQYGALSGFADSQRQSPVTDSTIFEIASLSKLFTSLLLAVAVEKQEVELDDPVQVALGDAVTLPTDFKGQITYRALANHRSGLPRLPDDLLKTADMENPYRHYTQEMLYACLNSMVSVNPIGPTEEYSNFGVGLLGHVLGKVAKSDYQQTLKERVLVPLGMLDTSIQSSEEERARLATPHVKKGKPTKHWDFLDATSGAGGLRSSLTDMCKFLRANVRPNESCLSRELALMREPSDLPIDKTQSKVEVSAKEEIHWSASLVGAVSLALFSVGLQWLFQIAPGSLFFFLLLIIPIYCSGRLFGFASGNLTLLLTTAATSWLWGPGFSWMQTLVIGTIVVFYGSVPEIVRS